jgi:hypothetical protein
MTGTILETVYEVSITVKQTRSTYLFDHTEAVCVVPLEIACAHECEDWHDVVQDSIGNQSRKLRSDKQSTLRGSGVG